MFLKTLWVEMYILQREILQPIRNKKVHVHMVVKFPSFKIQFSKS